MQKESIIMNRNNVLRKYKSLNNESKELFSTVFYIEQEILRPIANKVGLKPEDILLALNSNSTLIDLINHKRGIQPKKKFKGKKIATAILFVLVILFASLFGAFAFSSDFRHAAVEVFEDEGDDYSRVSSASADRGTADAVTFTFINYTAINCKGGRKGMEASFLAKP